MTLDPHLERLLSMPKPDPLEELKRNAHLLGKLEALIERRLEDVRIDALLVSTQADLDIAFDLLNDARDACADLERAFELLLAEVEDENLLDSLKPERRRGYEEGCRGLDERLPREAT